MRNFLQRVFNFSQPSHTDTDRDLERLPNDDETTLPSSSSTSNSSVVVATTVPPTTTRTKSSSSSSSGVVVMDRLTNSARIIESYRKHQVYPVTSSNYFYTIRNSSYQSGVGNDGFISPKSFEKMLLPNDFIGISQILCVSTKIYVLEEGSGRVYIYDGSSPIGFMKPFDGTRFKVVAIRGDTYGLLLWVYDTQDDCSLLYGCDQNHYDNVGVEIKDPNTAVLAFDPRSDTSSIGTGSGNTMRIITHVECAYSLSFCVTNGVEIRCSGQIIWCRPNNTSSTWRDIIFTTRSPIIDLQTHSFGFVALLADSTICVGGSNNHYESMHDTMGSYLDIRYITGLTYVPKQLFATSYSTIVRTTSDEFIEYGRGIANGNVQSGATGHPFKITSGFYTMQNSQIDNIYLKGGMIISFDQPNQDLRFIYTEGGLNGMLKLSSLYSPALISRGKIHCACNVSNFVFYEGAERGMSLDMGRKLFVIACREDKPLCDVTIISRDVSLTTSYTESDD